MGADQWRADQERVKRALPSLRVQEMVRAGSSPDLELFTAAMQAAAKAKSATEAERLYAGMRARGLRLDSAAAHYLLTALKAGGPPSQAKAAQIAEQLKRLSIVPAPPSSAAR